MTDEEKNSDGAKSLGFGGRKMGLPGSQPTGAEPPYFTDRLTVQHHRPEPSTAGHPGEGRIEAFQGKNMKTIT